MSNRIPPPPATPAEATRRILQESALSKPRYEVLAAALEALGVKVSGQRQGRLSTHLRYQSPAGAWRPLPEAAGDADLANQVVLQSYPQATAQVVINAQGVSVNIDAHGVRGLGANTPGDQANATWQALASLFEQTGAPEAAQAA